MASVMLCFLLCLSCLLLILPSSSSSSPSSSSSSSSSTSNTITLSLSPITKPHSSSNSNPWEFISEITKLTLERAHHLKTPKSKHSSKSSHVLHKTSEIPLYPRSYGGYSVSLSFGTPPQKIPLVFDTGSSLLWVPCTSRYTCSNCTFSHVDPSKIPTFKPKLSSSTRIIGCRSPRCGWLYEQDVSALCGRGCGSGCSRACPSYQLEYGLGATAGVAISETLDLPGEAVRDFFLGCSILSIRQPEGIAGFGRDLSSLPNQLRLSKFSYCLLSHKFDDTPKNSKLILTGARKKSCAGEVLENGVKYTPFRKNPTSTPYNEYYYVTLRKITVGKKHLNLPYKYLTPDPNGNGGTIVDSGSTLTYMERVVFDPLVKELAAQTTHYNRARDVEAQSGFGLCFHVSARHNLSFPELVFHFKGGAKMELPVSNYFSFINHLGVLCLTMISDESPAGPSGPVGPAVILGNNQQQNFYVEYDLENQRLGLKKHKCG